MKLLPAIFLLVAALSVGSQTVATTANVLHPIMKDPNKRLAPTSLDRADPSLSGDVQATAPGQHAALPSAQPAQPAIIIAKIDARLAASPVSMIGTVSGIKGRLYVTNTSSEDVTPLAQFAVCNTKGFQIGFTTKTGQPLAPNESEKIEVLATNLNAADLKLIKLTAGPAKK